MGTITKELFFLLRPLLCAHDLLLVQLQGGLLAAARAIDGFSFGAFELMVVTFYATVLPTSVVTRTKQKM
jgi:hypothetical protein